VLKKFTTAIKEDIRPDDYLARVGGEEFSLLLPNTTKEIAMDIAKRVLNKTRDIDFSYINKNLSITVSIGISFYIQDSSIESMIKLSDEKLYEAKRSGRDKICS
jgi:diguanylate cyclase (GGDEF)-like protein